MSLLEQLIISNGFSSLEEFNHLVASADLSTPEKFADFRQWQNEDGTKDGLLKLNKLKPEEQK